jgi:hypothetical protein
MERRLFLKSLFAVAGAVGIAAVLPAESMAMPISGPANGLPANPTTEPAVATPEDIEGAKVEDVQFFYRRRRRFIYRRRPRYIYRRRFFRPRYRRVYRRRVFFY